MSDPFVAEIRIVTFSFAPHGWAACDGQLLSIAQNTALFSLVGTFYGGDGKSSFALPNLVGQGAMGQGQGAGLSQRNVGDGVGEAAHTLIAAGMPAHTHTLAAAASTATATSPNGTVPAAPNANVRFTKMYGTATAGASAATGTAGSGTPHNNWHPYLILNYVIALQGIFPSRA